MSDFINDFLNNFGGDASNKIGSSLGIDPGIIQQAIPIIAPMILGGLMKQKQEYGSQDRVDHILNKYGDPNVLNNIDGMVNEKSQLDGDPNLGGLLGNSGSTLSNALSDKLGLNLGTAMKIIPLVAPLILGYLSNQRNNNPEGSAGFASFLDQNGDGNVIDDIAGFLGGGQQQQQSNQQNPLGSIGDMLGSLLGGK
jgi:hypothetical protein